MGIPAPGRDAQLNVYNFETLRGEAPDEFDYLRLDPNNNCNVQCVYCHNQRNDSVIAEDLKQFLNANVVSVTNFQMGCVMEPTLDKRMGDLLLMVRESRARPSSKFVLQTNGILLHMHDAGKIRAAGLTQLSVSIDSADPEVHRALRGGTSLGKVERNLVRFATDCPDVRMQFITTVTSLNLPTLDGLVAFGLQLGVSEFVFREVFYHPHSDVVDHTRMPSLMVPPGKFHETENELLSKYNGRASFLFADNDELDRLYEKILTDSRRPG